MAGLSFGGTPIEGATTEGFVSEKDDPAISVLTDAIRHLRGDRPKQAMAAIYDAMSIVGATHDLHMEFLD